MSDSLINRLNPPMVRKLLDRLSSLSEAERSEVQKLIGEWSRRNKQRKFFQMYPDTGPYRRELYPKHIEFMEAGGEHRERAMVAANRVGKTVSGAYETVCHVTGRYPHWWTGHRFTDPVNFWAAGDTAKTTRDIIQVELLGNHGDVGTGMIPGEDLVRTTPKAGVPEAVDSVYIKHYDGRGEQDGISVLQLKSYDQGRKSFQGTAQHGIWLDEECPMDVYTECLIRTMTTNGLIYLTFTPLSGLTEVVMMYMRETGLI